MEALRSARPAPAGAMQDSELERRRRRAEGARGDVEAGENALMAAGEALSGQRRRGAEDLTPLAIRLQGLEEERATALRSALADLAGSSLESASATRSAA